MSAARWRRAMSGQAISAQAPSAAAAAAPARDSAWAWRLLALAALLLYPAVASPFFIFQVGGQALVLGIVALSLAWLGGYGGMVTLSQMTVAGVAGYALAIFGGNASAAHSLGWPWWLAIAMALSLAVLAAVAIGALAVRTEGIYTIMITLAIGVAFFYLVQQNQTVFNGFQGLSRILPPPLFGVDWRAPVPFYYLALACALAAYCAVAYLARSPFGMALQGIRENPRRMRALGFNVNAHRIAAHALAGLMAGAGGVLLAWYNSQISPGSVGTTALINILIVAVIGGMRHPAGPFLGALLFVLLQNFAIDLVDRERFNLVIGGVFLFILAVSPDGLLGVWRRLARTAHPAARRSSS